MGMGWKEGAKWSGKNGRDGVRRWEGKKSNINESNNENEGKIKQPE